MLSHFIRLTLLCFALYEHAEAARVLKNNALQLRSSPVVLRALRGMDNTMQLTFEAWLSTPANCARAAIMSYALDSHDPDPATRAAAYNHFVVFDTTNIIACHDYHYIDLFPDPESSSCFSAYNRSTTADVTDRHGGWHHLAVTWDGTQRGLMRVFVDGTLRAEAWTGKVNPLQGGGSLMLGGEQDCYGGCAEEGQAYHGLLDEVRIWNVARSQQDIVATMRHTLTDQHTLEQVRPHLIAYYTFDQYQEEIAPPSGHGSGAGGPGGGFAQVAVDWSGNGNDLPLAHQPTLEHGVSVSQTPSLVLSTLSFDGGTHAINPDHTSMPTGDITVEFWAQTPALGMGALEVSHSIDQEPRSVFVSYATGVDGKGMGNTRETYMATDALRIEKDTSGAYTSLTSGWDPQQPPPPTSGSDGVVLVVHVNSNVEGYAQRHTNFAVFPVDWSDNNWHHIAVTWQQHTGRVYLMLDGHTIPPSGLSDGGWVTAVDSRSGVGAAAVLAAGSVRHATGSLVLGRQQQCYGGCYNVEGSLVGHMAAVRVWNTTKNEVEVQRDMYTTQPTNTDALLTSYLMQPSDVTVDSLHNDVTLLLSSIPRTAPSLILSGQPTHLLPSTAPLADQHGNPLPTTSTMQNTTSNTSFMHALYLHDQQVLIRPMFDHFPTTEVTVELWMSSVDPCGEGVPFSYAAGGYGVLDNALLLFNYNNWGIAVMEDEGSLMTHRTGISSTHGAWTHVALTWRSVDGRAQLYVDGRLAAVMTRAQGKTLPSGGTLVLGREQDCVGGCFDSAPGAHGPVTRNKGALEYGAQDFVGALGDVRLWRVVRTAQQIKQDMSDGWAGRPVAPAHQSSLVAHWAFNEGSGYTVHDRSGNGHDLWALYAPTWQLRPAPPAFCGDGIVSGDEECDLGTARNGHGSGCSLNCKIEPGWDCDRGPPSECWALEEIVGAASFGDDVSKEGGSSSSGPQGTPSSSTSTSDGRARHGAAYWVVVSVSVAAAIVGVAVALAAALGVQRGLEWRAHRMRNVAHGEGEGRGYEGIPLSGEEEGLMLGGVYAPLPSRSTL